MKRPVLDKFDDAILALMQDNSRLPVAQIARRIGLSEPACYRRMRQLRESGAIEREVAVVNAGALGWPIAMIVLVTLETDRCEVVDRMLKRLQGVPEVLDAWYVTGDHDFVLQVVARDMAHFENFARRVLHAETHVKSFKTLVVMRHGKKQAAIPASIRR